MEQRSSGTRTGCCARDDDDDNEGRPLHRERHHFISYIIVGFHHENDKKILAEYEVAGRFGRYNNIT